MDFTTEQENAVEKALGWYGGRPSPVFHLFGYAGTGKTTLAKKIASKIDGHVSFAAFTGKASYVLKTKGCNNARTIHSLIYHSRDKSKSQLLKLEEDLSGLIYEFRSEGYTQEQIENNPKVKRLRQEIVEENENSQRPNFILNRDSDLRNSSLLIVDECSMVDNRTGEDLLSFGVPILVLGDPAQLPPPASAGYFTENVNPDVMLTEIHRQEDHSPILDLATKARNCEPIPVGDYGDDVRVIDGRLSPEEILDFDQILVGKNVTRYASNRRYRSLLGIEDEYPVIGDKLVCLRNNNELGLLNGALFEVMDVEGVMDAKIHMTVKPDFGDFSVDLISHTCEFLGQDKPPFYEMGEAELFDYGYALTVHKSQGSQWDRVCLIDESYCFRKDRWKWLYTAITRAARGLTIVRN